MHRSARIPAMVTLRSVNCDTLVGQATLKSTMRLANQNIIILVAALLSGCLGGAESVEFSPVDPPPTIRVNVVGGNSVDEALLGGAVDFQVTLSEVSASDIEVGYQTSSGSALQSLDFTGLSGTLTIPAGSLSSTVSVFVINDTVDEPDEIFSLDLTSTSTGEIETSSATATILDDDNPPTISISPATLIEGDSGQVTATFVVALTSRSGFDISADFATADISATAGEDYVAASGVITITAGDTTTAIDVLVNGDTLDEGDETFAVSLSNPSNAGLGSASAMGMIVNDDSGAPPPVVISIGNSASVAEAAAGSTLNFPVSLSSASAANIDIQYQTVAGTALSGADFVPQNSSITILAGATSGNILVSVVDDTVDEANESLSVQLISVSSGLIGTPTGTGTILDNDDSPSLSIGDASINEGNSGSSVLSFPVSLSSASGLDVTASYQSNDGSAIAGEDYVAASGQVVISAGSTSATISITVSGDTVYEADETFDVSLTAPANASLLDGSATGTIVNDDALPTLSVGNAQVTEGDSGLTSISFSVALSGVSSLDVTFDFATANGSAIEPDDYVAVSGNRTIPAGSTTTTVTVDVVGDTAEEGNEDFLLNIANPSGATLANGSGTGTIIDDDSGLVSGLDARPSNLTCIAPDRPIVNTSISTQNAFPSLPRLSQPVGLMQAPGDSSQWYVIEQAGRVLRFANDSGVSDTSTVIDIRSPTDPIDVASGGEAGFLGMAFHPDYGDSNWYVYLSYTIDGAGTGGPFISIVSRFESRDSGLTLDPTSAIELLRLNQPFSNHNGGQISFGPDGYLYISYGDGGSGGDPGDRAQNTSNFFGAMLRIDVNSGSPYRIPTDNPFFGNGLCNTGAGAAACPEIFAWGLRNPWKWSFDDQTGQLWLADVGQNAWEEVDIIELGGNYGWRCREGAHNYNTSGNCPAGLIDPVIEYSHSVGNSITGGVVYHGGSIPELTGRYVFGDYSQGKIFASVDNGDGTYGFEQLLDTSFFISAFAPEADGELLFLNLGGGNIQRIVQSGGNSNDPVATTLSASGCVGVADPSQPAIGLIPYDINVPFWSDGAVKERFYAIPDGTSIDVNVEGDWVFPIGSVLMKNFRVNNELIETRLFMRHTDGEWAGYSYEWNDAGTDADRLYGAKTKTVSGQEWIYPSGSECMQCHTAAAGFSLGPEHGQLNKDFNYPTTGRNANQLVTADAVDLLTAPLGNTPDNLPRYADPTDTGEPLDARARAYLHSNCAGCHRPGGPTPSDMDLRHATPLQNTNTCDVIPVSGTLGIAGARIISPGNAGASLLVERASRRDSHGMPPLGSTIVDSAGVQLLTDWVNSLGSCP
jgi:uncharacterized repeat protein (TIGR03806 family)